MLKGTKIIFKGFPAFLAAADISTEDMEKNISEITNEKKYYQNVSLVSAMDIFSNPEEFKGLKRPLTAFVFINEEDREKFISEYESRELIKVFIKTDLDWEQEKMHTEDQVRADQETNEISSMEEIVSGKRANNMTIGALYGIDEEDPWDKRTEKEKAEDLLNGASMMQRLIEDGIFTDEAMAPSFEQSIEAQKLPKIDPDNIPQFLKEQFEKDGLDEIDIKRSIEEMNKQIDKHNEDIENGLDPEEERTKRIVGGNLDQDGNTTGIFINRDSLPGDRENKQKKQSNTPGKKQGSSIADLMKNTSMSTDDIKDILKPDTIDGKFIADFGKFLFDNTSLDSYDYADAASGLADINFSEIEIDVSDLPENIGKNSGINYSSDKQKVFDGKATRISEDEDAFIILLNSPIKNEDIIGTKNLKVYSVAEKLFSFVPNRIEDGFVMLVVNKEEETKIYKFEI